ISRRPLPDAEKLSDLAAGPAGSTGAARDAGTEKSAANAPDSGTDPKSDPGAPGASSTAVPAQLPVVPAEKPLLEFQLPTRNLSLLQNAPEKFFMFVDRYTPAGQIQVWEGGSYGFVRNPRETKEGTVYTKFHEGIDIAPFQRDAKGEPQDEVRAIAGGTVAYVTTSSRTSNYGNYVVILHQIGTTGVFYSLYAHLRSISVTPGTAIARGSLVGMMGYTGDGIDRRRAHTHLEMGLVLSERFEAFYNKSTALANGHGNFHGSNLIGMDVASFFKANQANPTLMPDAFLKAEDVYYKVLIPNRGHPPEIALRYPWLLKAGAPGASWEISFTGPGVPVAIAPAPSAVSFATVSWVRHFAGYHSWNTRSMLGGSGNTATLTAEGNRFLTLVSGDF
ncbi:MAG: Peptidase, partial [Verrucomicrobiales bacterium]|nr:Peptidase [Verrucomicrobiales bacterium]